MRMRLCLILAVMMVLMMPTTALAVAPYFEFNPDYSQSLLVASSDTVSEVFLPLNEFLSGFDFWVSNDSQGGDVTFAFFDDRTGTELSSSTVTVPAIADSQDGTRLHVNLPSQRSVSGGNPYRVTISTNVP